MASFENNFSHSKHVGCCWLCGAIEIHISDIPHYIAYTSYLLAVLWPYFNLKQKQTCKQYIYIYIYYV